MYFRTLTFQEVLDDLQCRFIINVPEEELASLERICFQIEQAHWFYEDFVREENPRLPSYSLKNFCGKFFEHCPLLHRWKHDHEKAFADFMEYKVRVPVCGAIILNERMDRVLLVKGWKASSGWGFPKGKINKDEPQAPCAVREVYEETGFDITPFLRVNEYVERTIKGQRIRLYIVTGVPETTTFIPQTRKEIGDIRWHKLNDLPGWNKDESALLAANIKRQKYYMVTAFVSGLRQWMTKFRKAKRQGKSRNGKHLAVVLGYNTATDSEGEGGASDAGMRSGTEGAFPVAVTTNYQEGRFNASSAAAVSVASVVVDPDEATRSIKALIGIRGSGQSTVGVQATVFGSRSENGTSEIMGISVQAQSLPPPHYQGQSPRVQHLPLSMADNEGPLSSAPLKALLGIGEAPSHASDYRRSSDSPSEGQWQQNDGYMHGPPAANLPQPQHMTRPPPERPSDGSPYNPPYSIPMMGGSLPNQYPGLPRAPEILPRGGNQRQEHKKSLLDILTRGSSAFTGAAIPVPMSGPGGYAGPGIQIPLPVVPPPPFRSPPTQDMYSSTQGGVEREMFTVPLPQPQQPQNFNSTVHGQMWPPPSDHNPSNHLQFSQPMPEVSQERFADSGFNNARPPLVPELEDPGKFRRESISNRSDTGSQKQRMLMDILMGGDQQSQARRTSVSSGLAGPINPSVGGDSPPAAPIKDSSGGRAENDLKKILGIFGGGAAAASTPDPANAANHLKALLGLGKGGQDGGDVQSSRRASNGSSRMSRGGSGGGPS